MSLSIFTAQHYCLILASRRCVSVTTKSEMHALATKNIVSQSRRLPNVRWYTSNTNRVQPSVRRPSDFHTLLQSSSTNNTLFLALFKTSTCRSCTTITPLLEKIIKSRSQPTPGDTYSALAFAELELDSADREDDTGGRGWTTMYDVAMEYGVRSVPTLVGFGGRRAERVTDRLSNEKQLSDEVFMRDWIDSQMSKGDPHPSQSGGLLSSIFGNRS